MTMWLLLALLLAVAVSGVRASWDYEDALSSSEGTMPDANHDALMETQEEQYPLEEQEELEDAASEDVDQLVELHATADAEAEEESDMPVVEDSSEVTEDETLPTMLELSAEAEAASGVQWRDGVRRRKRWGRSLREEREKAWREAQEDKRYKENLLKLRARLEKWKMPHPRELAGAVHAAVDRENAKRGVRPSSGGPVTNEEAQVESLIQISSEPLLKLHHMNNEKAPLTLDTLLGRGMANPANRAATERGLEGSALNRPPAPALEALPFSAGQFQPSEVSFVQQASETRPSYAGPHSEELPTTEQKASILSKPIVELDQPILEEQSTAKKGVSEEQFVNGLPEAFMELDAATQLQVLALADAGVNVDAEAETETENQNESTTEVETDAGVDSESDSESEIDSDELAKASGALSALAALHQESHVPFSKLIHLLAKGKEE